jgi:hypothetical protein
MDKLFELAARKKFRFFFHGLISVEDLWDLQPEDLDSIYRMLSAERKAATEDSLLHQAKENKELIAKIEIVKHIVAVKLDEARKKREAKERREKKEKLLEILAQKENENLLSQDAETIRQMVQDLDGEDDETEL